MPCPLGASVSPTCTGGGALRWGDGGRNQVQDKILRDEGQTGAVTEAPSSGILDCRVGSAEVTDPMLTE